LIWRISADLKRFKKITMGGTLIMGRKTFESIGKPLPGRVNIVLTKNKHYRQAGIWTVRSADEALSLADCLGREVFVIGGSSIYKIFWNNAERLYLTEIEANDSQAGVFFPERPGAQWKLREKSEFFFDEKNKVRYRFTVYERLPLQK
jgi:dihydrofolate reductase